MAIQNRRGSKVDFDPNKMLPGEFGYALDTAELYYCYGAGNVKKLMTVEDLQTVLNSSVEAYTALQQLISELENETVLTGMLNDISGLQDNFSAHLAEEATDLALGHVMVGSGVNVDVNGKISIPTVPACRVYHSTTQSIPNNVFTVLAFDTEKFDTENMHDVTTSNSRLTCKTAGKYMIVGQLLFDINATGERQTYIRLNGSTVLASDVRNAVVDNGSTGSIVSTIYDLRVNDYVELLVRQKSGGALNVLKASDFSPDFMMVKVG